MSTDIESPAACQRCAYYANRGQCRRNPPISGMGFPSVLPADWCGKFARASDALFVSPDWVVRMKPAWTPGSWMAAAGPSSIVGWPIVASPSGRSIASVSFLNRKREGEGTEVERAYYLECQANAHVLAAAPSLYEALAACLPWMGDAEDIHTHFPESVLSPECKVAVKNARTALARARGEQP